MKLLKKIEKLHKNGEKKFVKLDSKLDKLENKTKRLLEKKPTSHPLPKKEKSDTEEKGNKNNNNDKAPAPIPKRKHKKKKSSDEDSSDANLIPAQRDVKLLKKIEKLHRSGEKKFEKLDSKLEKLENKTKRLLERKSQSKSRGEKKDKSVEAVEKGGKQRKRSSDILAATYLMDVVLLDPPLNVVHCARGEQFVKIWNVVNNGTLPWTDKTELCLAWGTPGMRFEKKVIKCPQLRPGEKGRIKVKAQAPVYPGTFESYWHFYHMGERFGHWIDCAVIVEGGEIRQKYQACENTRDVDFLANNNMVLLEKIGAVGNNVALLEKIGAVGNNMALLEKIGNEKEVEEKIIQMAELTQKLHGLQRDLSQNDSKSLTNSMASDTVKENQRKIAENMVEIQKRLDDISLLHSPPSANKILEMAFGDDFCCKKDSVDEGIDGSDNADEIDINHITGKNIEPAEWKMLQLHPEFLKSCDLLREVQLRDGFTEEIKKSNENLCTLKRDFHQHMCEHKNDFNDLINCYEDNDLNKPQDVSDSFDKNIEGRLGLVVSKAGCLQTKNFFFKTFTIFFFLFWV